MDEAHVEKKSMIAIRLAGPADIGTIADFQVAMALETENIMLDPGIVRRGVSAVFDDPSKGFYLVADDGSQTIGCLLITLEWSDWRNRHVWWIQSLYVLAPWRRQGVFKSMYAWIADRIRDDEGIGGIRLYVDQTNTRAQAVYDALGMDGNHYRFYEDMKHGG